MNHQKKENVKSILRTDRISNLPKNVVKTILVHLPTRDAVRTSILSRKWRYKWVEVPQFILDEELWKNMAGDCSAKVKLTIILYQLLTCRGGPINKFTLSNPELVSCPEIDNLILLLSRSHLEDFTLVMWKDSYLLPYSFFSCQELRHLRLTSCSIRNLPAFKGFNRLDTLKLEEVIIPAGTLANLISRSPLLRVLELNISSDIDVCIDAPNLRMFTFRGRANSIFFKRVPVLASVSLKPSEGLECDMDKFFQRLLRIESLELNNNVVENFVFVLHKSLPTTLVYLKDIKFFKISFNEIDELGFIFWLLMSSPNLKFVEILFENYPGSNSEKTTSYIKGKYYSDIWLSELKVVKLDGVTGTKPELEFMRLLLARSSNLKEVQVQLHEDVYNGYEILKNVTRFPRLSKEAEIIFA